VADNDDTPGRTQDGADVEQKVIFPILTLPYPEGLGFLSSDIAAKLSTRRLEIGKGTSQKLYYPDYIVALAGLPVLIVEAKGFGEPLMDALHEARLYAGEINALFPQGINPAVRVIACNGEELWSAPNDTLEPDIKLSHADFSSAKSTFAAFVEKCRREAFQSHVDNIRSRLRQKKYRRPVSLVGGGSFQNEELAQNTFGATIAGDYGHIFNPITKEDRENIAKNAYIGSLRLQRYVEPIDRLIRNAVAPTAAKIKALENSADPRELTAALRDRKKLEDQIVLLVGSVGAGKSTFVDHLSLVALPPEMRERTVWIRLNLNDAPLSIDRAYEWTASTIVQELRDRFPEIDFDDFPVLEKVFGIELKALKKGALAVLPPDSPEYLVRISDRLSQLQSNPLELAKGIARYTCTASNRLLVVVLDNCDKRNRDEQLTMFQLASWVRSQFRCLVMLPLRDVTFDLHRYTPPLDTALKQFVFRIEPPQFSDVLQARVRLALAEISKNADQASSLSFTLPNGMKVNYPAEDQALYLTSMLRSLYAHDRFVRQVMTGLAGRDVRRALEIFLEFCMSGHIGEDQILNIRLLEGQYVLPLSVVARVLLRMQRRFYDGDRSYLKNVVQCDPSDPFPDHFVRLAALHWFEQRLGIKGPAGVEGFHRAADMIGDLAALGHDAQRARAELGYLIREGCLVAEHLRVDSLSDDDLVKITSSGVVHLQLMSNPEYLAACAEDTAIGDQDLCKKIAERISKGVSTHTSPFTTARNSIEFVSYLMAQAQAILRAPQAYLSEMKVSELKSLADAEAAISAAEVELPERLFVGGLPFASTEAEFRQVLAEHNIDAKNITFPLEKGSGKSRGFAFVTPKTKKGVLDLLELNETLMLRGRTLRISEAQKSEETQGKFVEAARPIPSLSKRLYVGNLPYSYGVSDLRGLLAEHEFTTVDIYLLTDKKSGRSRGAAFVEMKSIDDATKVIGTLNEIEIAGRRIVVRPADSKNGNQKH
jgi:RNA recognition motif-containing protein